MKSLKAKVIIGLLGIQIIIFAALGYTIFNIMQKELVNKLRAYMLSLAQACAGSIDPIKHSAFTSLDARKDPDYWRYFKYLNTIYTREEYISYIFTLNYDKEKDSFFYAVDGATAESDKIWMESSLVGFSVYSNQLGQLTVRYDSIEHNNDFTIQTNKGQIQIGIINKGRLKKILINGMEVIKVIAEDPLIILSAGKEIHPLNRKLKIQMPLFESNEIFTLTFTGKGDPESDPGAEYIVSEVEKEKNRFILKSGKDHVDDDAKSTSYGNDITATAIIKDALGNPVGMVIIYMESKTFKESKDAFLATASIVFIFTFFGTSLIGFLFANYIANPISSLNRGVKELSEGNLHTQVILPREDEFGDLANRFNQMVNKIRIEKENSDRLNIELATTVEAYSRFVPMEFLSELGQDSIINVKLGDQLEKEMTILFSDIRSFTSLSETMTPEENFQFINGYLGRVSPIIRKHGGFIDKYIGDAVMALFPNKPQDAILASLEMQKEVFIYNSHRLTSSYTPIQIGIGLHTGSVILGTVGEERRMEGTVISDVVNTASRLESLTKTFGASILISDEIYTSLSSIGQYQFRFLGRIRVKGKRASISIYELLDAAPTETIAKKIQTRGDFQYALELYWKQSFFEALEVFSEILFKNKKDKAAEYYLKQIQRYIKNGAPDNWDGIEEMDVK